MTDAEKTYHDLFDPPALEGVEPPPRRDDDVDRRGLAHMPPEERRALIAKARREGAEGSDDE